MPKIDTDVSAHHHYDAYQLPGDGSTPASHVAASLPKILTTQPELPHQQNTKTASARYHEQFGLPSFDDHVFVIFGYGSILWKQNFEFDAEYETYIKGYKRVFYQGSRDHRGVPDKPGRVVTLLPSEDKEQRVYGKAYQLPADPEKLNKIFQALDVREGGYDRVQLTLFNAHPTTGNLTTTPILPASMPKSFKTESSTQYVPPPRQNSSDVEAGDAEEVLDIFSHPNAPAVQPRKNVVCLCYIATEQNEGYVGEASMEAMAEEILSCAGVSGSNREYLFFLADCLRAMGATDPHVFELDAVAKRILRGREAEFAAGAKRVATMA
ncbi:ChaC-like protein [Leishmania donovani]|uniref:glutathione-specific gamma-glutamylcyclotransferase n=1 Tax=Leishmania donovani TaxID=5661 RepID=A0A504Y4H9_LEIDO|nr:ChaC-like family protein [Leishmania donovani]CAJ1988821.1 ChaC-like protein [Leishmania donovani]VDZ44699.1 ChaC-like_protein_putative/Pfam:PF04752 [Leishmania donovani]